MKDVETIALLARAYAGELETVQNYLANSVWLDGLGAQEVSESLAEEMTEELGHAQKLAHRLKQLGACPPGSLKLERRQKSLQPPAESTDLLSVVQGVLDAENEAIAYYHRQIIKASEGKDHVTQDLAVKLQADEEEHRCLFEGFLKSLKKENPRAENQMRTGSSASTRICRSATDQLGWCAPRLQHGTTVVPVEPTWIQVIADGKRVTHRQVVPDTRLKAESEDR